jgi:aryl-alcohol dehydrogenase-like predicted oxidoreductase
MEYRRLGNSGLEVSPICLGAMMFGDRTDAAAAQGIVDAAFGAGINFIDTADNYSKGASERMVGQAIKAHRSHWILATKVANIMTTKPHDGGLSRRWVLRGCDDSLARLATDYIDIYYLHRDDPDTPIAPARSAISACPITAAGGSPKSSANARRRACRCRSSASPTTTC